MNNIYYICILSLGWWNLVNQQKGMESAQVYGALDSKKSPKSMAACQEYVGAWRYAWNSWKRDLLKSQVGVDKYQV